MPPWPTPHRPAGAAYLRADLGISRSQIGIAFAVFSVVGGLAAPLVGGIADRSTRAVMAGLFGLSAASVLMTAAAAYYWLLLAAALVGGLSFAAGNPVTNRLVLEEVSSARRGLALGIKQTGPPLALLAAGVFVPPVAALIGWRWAFGMTAIVPLAGILISRRLVPRRAPARADRAISESPAHVMHPCHAGASGLRASPVPIMLSRLTRAVSSSSLIPSEPSGRMGSTR